MEGSKPGRLAPDPQVQRTNTFLHSRSRKRKSDAGLMWGRGGTLDDFGISTLRKLVSTGLTESMRRGRAFKNSSAAAAPPICNSGSFKQFRHIDLGYSRMIWAYLGLQLSSIWSL